MDYETKSTGKPFREFSTGSLRDNDEGKPRPGLISPYFTRRLGALLARGAKKYGERNWEYGQPFSQLVESLERHLLSYKAGEKDEDHLAAIGFGVMCLTHEEQGIEQGWLPGALDDMPHYASHKMAEYPERMEPMPYPGADIITDDFEADLDDMFPRPPLDVKVIRPLSDQEINKINNGVDTAKLHDRPIVYNEFKMRNPDGTYDD